MMEEGEEYDRVFIFCRVAMTFGSGVQPWLQDASFSVWEGRFTAKHRYGIKGESGSFRLMAHRKFTCIA